MKKLLVFLLTVVGFANADVIQNEQVYAAANVIKSFGCDKNNTTNKDYVKNAKAVAILTDVTRTGLVASVQGGNGVFVARDLETGEWTAPIMIRYRGFGAGVQAGIQSSDIIILFQTSNSYRKLFSGDDTLELNAGAAIANGKAAGVGTNLPEVSAWTVRPGEVSGLYIGASLDFGRLTIDNQATNDYYGRIYEYQDILNGSPRDTKYTKILKHALNVYLGYDEERAQCGIDKFPSDESIGLN